MRIKANLLTVLLIVVISLLAIVVASGTLVLAAAGVGWVLTNWLRLPFSPFETALLSLIALLAVAWAAVRLIVAFVSSSLGAPLGDESDGDDWAEDKDDTEEDDDLEEQAVPVPSIPKWRQPLRRVPVVDPDEKCPCGSGRKYKNCHGQKPSSGER